MERASGGGSTARLLFLDGLRALAALYVLASHSVQTIYDGRAASARVQAVTGWLDHGPAAVTVFIVLSGYSLSIATTRHGHTLGGARRFFLRRFQRIVLPYWGALVISVVLATTLISRPTGTHWDGVLPVTASATVWNALLLQDFTHTGGKINHAFWSIAIEWHIYVLFPLLLLLRRRLGLAGATALVVVISAVVSALQPPAFSTQFLQNSALVAAFATGMAAQQLAVGGGTVLLARWRIQPAWGWAAAAAFVVHVLDVRLLGPLPWLPLTASCACLLLHCTSRPSSWLRRGLEARALVWVGTFSYSLYLVHAPIEQLLWQDVMRPFGLPLRNGDALAIHLVLSVVVSLAAAYAYFLLVERRCMPTRMRTAVAGELRSDRAS